MIHSSLDIIKDLEKIVKKVNLLKRKKDTFKMKIIQKKETDQITNLLEQIKKMEN